MWTELSEFGCKFRRHFCRSRCNCSCVTFCTNYKYERDRALGNRLVISSEEATAQAILFNFSNAVKKVHMLRSRDTVQAINLGLLG